MAANMKAVKLRIKSVESTMQITKLWNLWRPPSCERPRSGRIPAVLIFRSCTVHYRK